LRQKPEKEMLDLTNKKINFKEKKIKKPENVSDILKDEINQLKILAKQANSYMDKEDDKLLPMDSEKLENEKSENKNVNKNGPLEDEKQKNEDNLENLDVSFLENKAENKEASCRDEITKEKKQKKFDTNIETNFSENKISTQLSKSKTNNIFFSNQSEEENKIEFEEKFNYLLNKLDVVYQITNK
jgi:hypothetical protein